MEKTYEPLFAKPSKEHLSYTYKWTVVVAVIFAIVYYSCNFFNVWRGVDYPLYFDWELEVIPLWPWMSIIYASPLIPVALFPFLVRRREEVKEFMVKYLICIGIAGVVFVLLPTLQHYPKPEAASLGVWAGWQVATDTANATYNCVPSLHVCDALLQAQAISRRKSPWVRGVVLIWEIGVIASTLLTHAHHVVDLPSALAVFLIADFLVRKNYHRLVGVRPPALASGEVAAPATR